MLINARDPRVISDEKQFLTGNEFGQFEYSCILHRKQIQNKTQQKKTTNKQNEKKIKTKKKIPKIHSTKNLQCDKFGCREDSNDKTRVSE